MYTIPAFEYLYFSASWKKWCVSRLSENFTNVFKSSAIQKVKMYI